MQKAGTIFHVRLLIVYMYISIAYYLGLNTRECVIPVSNFLNPQFLVKLLHLTYCILTSFCALSCPSTIQIDLAKFFQSFILTVNAFHIRNKSTYVHVTKIHCCHFLTCKIPHLNRCDKTDPIKKEVGVLFTHQHKRGED